MFGLNVRNRAHAYSGSGKGCGACSQKAQCTSGRYKYLAIHMPEPARQRARDVSNTPAFASAQRKRKKVEALFAELKNVIGLRRLRRMKFVRERSSSQRRPRTSSDWCGSSANPQPPLWKHLAEVRRKNSPAAIIAAKKTFRSRTFSTPTPD